MRHKSGDFTPPLCGKQRARRYGAVVEFERRRQRRPQREFALDQRRRETRRALFDQESTDRAGTFRVDAGFALDLGPHHRHVGDGAVANPLLRSAEAITVGGLACAAAQTTGIRTEVRLRECKTTELRALRHRRQPEFFLLFRAEQIDRHHGERALHGGESAQSTVAPFELLHHQPGGDTPEPGTAVAFDARPEDTELCQLRHELHREGAIAIMLRDHRQKTLLHPVAHGISYATLVRRQQFLEIVEVNRFERWHRVVSLAAAWSRDLEDNLIPAISVGLDSTRTPPIFSWPSASANSVGQQERPRFSRI